MGINGDYVPHCDLLNPAANGECGAMDNQNFGKEFFTRTFDPDFINGWGKRPYNWEMGVSVQQEVAPRVGVTVGYFRRWFGNFYTLDNTPDRGVRLHAVQRPDSGRSAAAGRRRRHGDRLYNLDPEQGRPGPGSAQLLDSNFGTEPTENWQGVDVSVNARLRNGLTVQGGTSTGRTLQDNCARAVGVAGNLSAGRALTAVQTARGTTSTARLTNPYCRVVEPFHDLVPRPGDVHRAEDRCPGERHVAERPGPELAANYVVTSAIAQAQPLGRNLSSGNITVNLIRAGHALRRAAATTSTSASRRSSASAGRARRSASTSTTC